MRNHFWKVAWLGVLAAAGLSPRVWAQVPAVPAAPVAGVPAVPGAAPVAGAPAAPAAAPAAPSNLWSFLCPTPGQLAACKAKFCACPLGQLMSNSMVPMSAYTGGMIPPCCNPLDPNAADLALPADSAEGAAARI